MSAVESPPTAGVYAPPEPAERRRERRFDWRWALALTALLVVALLLRLWGIDHGLPYAYNSDENAHFVPKAIGLFGHDWNPEYFVNPPGYTYLLHLIFAVWYGGGEGVSDRFAVDPTHVFELARIVAALLGVLATGLLYLAGARLFDRRVGFLAAAILAFAFLPNFYAHLALNDVPALVGVCLALVGAAGIVRNDRWIDYAVAGAGLGLGCATKYTAGIVLLPIIAAALSHGVRALPRLAVAGGVALGAFLVANPYALLDFDAFRDGLEHQSTASAESGGKLGLTQESGILYYLWTFTWGLGWAPALAAVAGAVALAFRDRVRFWMLTPAPIVFVIFMGTQERFFGRWLMPVFPIVCLLAAAAAFMAVDWLGERRPALRPVLGVAFGAILCFQGVLYSVHLGQTLSREDTRNIAREWVVEHVPETSKIVVEPGVVPDGWATDIGEPSPLTSNGNRWIKYATSRTYFNEDGSVDLDGPGRVVNIEDYERTLRPELIDDYERGGYCWVISGSTQSGRAYAEPEEVPEAIDYYRRLRARGGIAYRISPYDEGAKPVEFNFDWSFDYYPLAYERPGPIMTIYKLDGGQCA
jgi:hypothetical protein